MVDVALFRDREFSGGIVALMLWAFGLFGIYFFTSLYLQDVLGFSPTKAGLAFVPMALCLVAGSVLSERVGRAVRRVPLGTGFGMLLMGIGDRGRSAAGRGRVVPRADAELRR